MKKLIAMTLSIMMLTLFVPASFGRAASTSLSITKSEFLVFEPVTVTVTGLTHTQIADQDAFVGVYRQGDKVDANAIVRNWVETLKNNIWTFKAPDDFGPYEIRLYWSENGQVQYKEKLDFAVVSNQAKPGDLAISVDKALVYDPIKVTVTGLTDGQVKDANAWAGVFKVGDSFQTNALERVWLETLRDGKTWEFKAPDELGEYEIRVFTKNAEPTELEKALFGKLSLRVISNPAKDGDLKISADRFLVNDPIKITLTGLTNSQVKDANAWAGIFNVTDDFKANAIQRVWIETLRDGKTWEITAPTEYGKYEVRVFTQNVEPVDLEKVLFGRIPFLVGSNPAQKGDIKLNKEAYRLEENVVLSLKGLTPGQIADNAWIGLYRPTDDFKANPIESTAVSSLRDGKTWTFKAPTEPGVWELRVFTANLEAEDRELAFFGRAPFTVLNQKITITDTGAFSWSNYKMKVTPTNQLIVAKGGTYKVKVTAQKSRLAPVPANVLVKYLIGNNKIATVDRTGVIQGIAKGTTMLTISGGTQKVVLKVLVR